MHEKFQLVQSRRQFSRLMDLCERQQKELAENPAKFLDQAYAEVSKSRKALEDVKAALLGLDEMRATTLTDHIESIAGTLKRRHGKALQLIRAAERRGDSHEK